jgi:hypothetical protein
MTEAASTSEILVNFYHSTWCNNAEDSHLHTRCCENLKSCPENCLLVVSDLLECIEICEIFFRNIVTSYETRVYGCDPESKQQSSQSKFSFSLQLEKVC